MNTPCTAMYVADPGSALTNCVAMRCTPQRTRSPPRSRSPRNPALRPRHGQNSAPAAMCERGRQREPDGRHAGEGGGEARLHAVQHEHVHELEAFGDRVRAPGEEQVLEEADTVRRVEVREDQ